MNGVIYCLTSPSGKKYVGKTINYRLRMNQHYTARNEKDKSHYPLYLAINKYGWDSFTKEKLADHIGDADILSALECEFIAKFKQDGVKLYNLTDGGEGTSGWVPDARFRKEKGKKMIELWSDPEYHAAQCQARKDAWTDERRNLVSERMSSDNGPTTKLKEHQVISIIDRLKTEAVDSIAAEFDVHPSTIFRIKSGRTRQHLSRPDYEVDRPKTKAQVRLDRLAAQAEARSAWAGQIKTMLMAGFSYEQVASVFAVDYSRIVAIALGNSYSDCEPRALEGEIAVKAALITPDVANMRPWKYKNQSNPSAIEHNNKIGVVKSLIENGYRTKHISLFANISMSGVGRIRTGKTYANVLLVEPTREELETIERIVAGNPLRGKRQQTPSPHLPA